MVVTVEEDLHLAAVCQQLMLGCRQRCLGGCARRYCNQSIISTAVKLDLGKIKWLANGFLALP